MVELFNGYNWQTRILEVRPDRLPPEFDVGSAYGPSQGYGAVEPRYGNMMMGSRFAAPMNGGRREPPPPRAFANTGMGMGPAPSRFSPALGHVPPVQSLGPRGSVGSVSPFVDEGEGFKTSPFNGHRLPVDRAVSPGSVGLDTSPTMRQPPVGLGAFPDPTTYDSRNFSPFAAQGHASLSRSVLQPRFPDSRPPQRPAPPSRTDTLGGRLLYVENLPPAMQWQELKDLFRAAGGTVVRADIATTSGGGGQGEQRGKGYGTVLFSNEGDAVAAVERFDG